MYGAIIGDIVGSKFEFDRGNKSKDFPLFTRRDTFTDDTVMTVAVAEALMASGKDADEATVKKNLIKSMKKWGQRYPNAGYGARFISWVLSDDPRPYGSYGNGSGMRVSAAGWLYDTVERTREVARWTAEVTHNHPEGIKGAESTAAAIFLARNGADKEAIEKYLVDEFDYDLTRTLDDIRPKYSHHEDCMKTMPEAFECFLESESYEDALRNVMYIGGDTDTLGAIAGAIAEAFWGIPVSIIVDAKEYLTDDILEVLSEFNKAVHKTNPEDVANYANNKYIKMAVAQVNKSDDVECKVQLLGVLHKRMLEGGEAPMPMIDVNNVLGDLSADDIKVGVTFQVKEDMRLRMDTVKDSEGNEWFPLFTDDDELGKQPTTNISLNMKIEEMLRNGLTSDRVKGVVINPFGESMTLTKEVLEILFTGGEKGVE